MCFDESGGVVLAVEVNERKLTPADARVSARKAWRTDTESSDLQLAGTGSQRSERNKIDETMERAWASGSKSPLSRSC